MTLAERHELADQGTAEVLLAVEMMKLEGTYSEAASLGVASILASLQLDKRVSTIEDKLGIEFPSIPGAEEAS